MLLLCSANRGKGSGRLYDRKLKHTEHVSKSWLTRILNILTLSRMYWSYIMERQNHLFI
jgi:hypothetical protein